MNENEFYSEELSDTPIQEDLEESSDSEESSDQEESSEVSFDQEEISEESSEDSSEVTVEQIDYTESLTQINDHLDLISNRLDYVGASFWILLSLVIAIIMYRLFAWFWKDF